MLTDDRGTENRASWRRRIWLSLDRLLENFEPTRLATSRRARVVAGGVLAATSLAMLGLIRWLVGVVAGM